MKNFIHINFTPLSFVNWDDIHILPAIEEDTEEEFVEYDVTEKLKDLERRVKNDPTKTLAEHVLDVFPQLQESGVSAAESDGLQSDPIEIKELPERAPAR